MDEFPNEPWIVCFTKDGEKIIRKFWAGGYYNAFDKALTYAEKRGFDILWCKEKRYCYPDKIADAKELETFCIYCNSMFVESNAIQCDMCKAIICSKECYKAHTAFKHKVYPKENDSSKLFPAL
jgi:hypothetical protein